MWDFGVGYSEMLLVAIIALIVFGPEKFPEYAKIFFRAMKDFQGYIQEVKADLAKEVIPIKNEIDKLNRQDPEKLLDALMKTGGSEEKKEVTSASRETYPAASPSDTPQTDADNNPYPQTSEPAPEEKTQEAAPAGPTITGDGAQYAHKDEFFNAKPPERMD